MRNASLSWIAPLLLAGCAVDPEPVGTSEQASVKCPWWGCGGNSSLMGPWEFHELDPGGRANEAGIRLDGMIQDHRRYQPVVVGARLIGRSLDEASYPSIAGADLTDASLVLDTPDGTYFLVIRHVSKVTPFWVGDPQDNETYELEYSQRADGSHSLPLCGNPPDPDDPDASWPAALEALLFSGDRYDAKTKQVIATGDSAGDWFNIACAGSALAKLHLTRHTSAGADSEHKSTAADRQALLKMYTADVCGTGESFTHVGEPLHWQNVGRWVELDGDETSIEGLWSADGAVCLDEHRLEADPAYAGITEEIRDTCYAAGRKVPPCDEQLAPPADWQDVAYVISANP